MKPESKLKERNHPENRSDADAGHPTSGWEDTVFEGPLQKDDRKQEPKRERNSADKVYDNEE